MPVDITCVHCDRNMRVRDDLANRAMLFASMMPNIKGPEAGRPIQLMDWQKLTYANVFGFVERGSTTRRCCRSDRC